MSGFLLIECFHRSGIWSILSLLMEISLPIRLEARHPTIVKFVPQYQIKQLHFLPGYCKFDHHTSWKRVPAIRAPEFLFGLKLLGLLGFNVKCQHRLGFHSTQLCSLARRFYSNIWSLLPWKYRTRSVSLSVYELTKIFANFQPLSCKSFPGKIPICKYPIYVCVYYFGTLDCDLLLIIPVFRVLMYLSSWEFNLPCVAYKVKWIILRIAGMTGCIRRLGFASADKFISLYTVASWFVLSMSCNGIYYFL